MVETIDEEIAQYKVATKMLNKTSQDVAVQLILDGATIVANPRCDSFFYFTKGDLPYYFEANDSGKYTINVCYKPDRTMIGSASGIVDGWVVTTTKIVGQALDILHRKLVSYTGGLNIQRSYYEKFDEFFANLWFKDTAVVITPLARKNA